MRSIYSVTVTSVFDFGIEHPDNMVPKDVEQIVNAAIRQDMILGYHLVNSITELEAQPTELEGEKPCKYVIEVSPDSPRVGQLTTVGVQLSGDLAQVADGVLGDDAQEENMGYGIVGEA